MGKSHAQKILEEGMEKGIEEGILTTLKPMIAKKFSRLPADLEEKLDHADREELIKIRDGMFDFESLEEIREILE